MSRSKLFAVVIVVSWPSILGLFGCTSGRDRPTGVAESAPVTTVTVVEPQNNDILPVDSLRSIVVEAEGSLIVVEVFMVRTSPADTVIRRRREFGSERLSLEEVFTVRIPSFPTGTRLEVVAAVEDALGQRYISEPVFVSVIECDVFTIACDGL